MRYLTKLSAMAIFLWSMIFYNSIFGQENIDLIPGAASNLQYELSFLDNPSRNGTFSYILPPKDPFYQVFWIFGDGNYQWDVNQKYKSTDPHIPVFVNPSTPNHIYLAEPGPGGTTYETGALIIERKSDDPPPSKVADGYDVSLTAPRNMVNIIGPGSGLDDYIKYNPIYSPPILSSLNVLGNCERVALEKNLTYNEFRGKGVYTIAFYLEQNHAGKLLFFYKDASGGLDRFIGNPPPGGSLPTAFIPRYGDKTLKNTPPPPLIDATIFSISPGGYYDNVISYKIDPSDTTIDSPIDADGKEELRIFYVLEVTDVTGNYDPLETLEFMVILGDTLQDTVCADNNKIADGPFISNYVHPSTNEIGIGSGLYYVDADIFYLGGKEPVDPNKLLVKDICECQDGVYEVTFELTFCNITDIPIIGANISIEDIMEDDFSCYKKISVDEGVLLDESGDTCRVTDFYDPYEANYFVRELPGLKLDTTTPEGGNCAKFVFSALTDIEGLERLNESLKACVGFLKKLSEPELSCDTVCSKVCFDTSQIEISVDPNSVSSDFFDAYYNPDIEIWLNKDQCCKDSPSLAAAFPWLYTIPLCPNCCGFWCYLLRGLGLATAMLIIALLGKRVFRSRVPADITPPPEES